MKHLNEHNLPEISADPISSFMGAPVPAGVLHEQSGAQLCSFESGSVLGKSKVCGRLFVFKDWLFAAGFICGGRRAEQDGTKRRIKGAMQKKNLQKKIHLKAV